MFLDNKYTKWYFDIIENAKDRINEGYTEKHHIIPKSCGGDDSTDNLVKLSAREHFICHLLLIKAMSDDIHKTKMARAAWFFQGNHQHRELKINSHTYEQLKQKVLEVMRNRVQSAEEIEKRRNSCTGKKLSIKQKKNISKGIKKHYEDNPEAHEKRSLIAKEMWSNRTEAEMVELSRKFSEAAKKRPPMSEETKEKCASFHRGRKRSEETKKKMSTAKKQQLKKIKVTKKKSAKGWKLQTKSGEIIEVEDLRKFARDNGLKEKALYRSKESGKYVGDYLVLGNLELTYEIEVNKQK